MAAAYLCFRCHVWKAQQWLGYVSSASCSSARLCSGGRVFRAKAELALRNLTCLNPLEGRELRAVEETSLNHRHTVHWIKLVKELPKNCIVLIFGYNRLVEQMWPIFVLSHK